MREILYDSHFVIDVIANKSFKNYQNNLMGM